MNTVEKIKTKKAAEALRVSEVRYRRLFEAAKDGILILNAETGMVIDVNPFLIELLGFSHEAFLGKEVWELGFFKDIVANKAKFEELQQKKYVRYENLPLETTDGRRIAVEFVSNVYLENSHKVIQCNIRDITERKQAESLRRFATVVKDSNDAITIQDFDGKITVWNRGAELMYGYSEAEALLANIDRLTAPGKVEEQKDFIRRLLAGEKVTSFETQRMTKDGRILDVWLTVTKLMDDAGKPIGLASTERDITERKKEEEKLKGIETLLQAAVDIMPVGLWIFDAEGKLLTSSTAAQRIWAGVHYVGVDQLGEYKGWRIDSGKLIEAHEWAGARAFEKGETSIEEEVEIECFDGTHKIILDSAVPLRKSDGSIGGAITINQDITERKQAEGNLVRVNEELRSALNELRKAQAQMVREERLSALGQMASGIAHDFNNMLMPIVGYSDILLSQPELMGTPDALSMIKDISTAAQDAKQIVHRMRLIRDAEDEGEYISVDLNKIISSALDLTRSRWEKEMESKGVSISMVKRLDADKPVIGNESQIREALMNIILNAVDAMPKGGTLTISSTMENDAVLVDVSDTGIGMPDDVKQRCGEPFFTTKGIKGTGLGLSMVHGIVKGHGGTMTIESEMGRGTTIRLRFPCVSSKPAHKRSVKEKTEGDFIITPIRILVADDDANSRALIVRFLKKDGHSVEAAGTGREAVNKAKAGIFDLVITDRAMPEGNGDVVALFMRKLVPEVPVILLTGFGDIMKDDGEYPEGVDKILCKPITHQDLREAMAKVMGK